LSFHVSLRAVAPSRAPVLAHGAAGERTLALILAAPYGKPLEPCGTRLPALRHVLSSPPARRRELAGSIPHLVPPKGLTLPFHRGLLLTELLLSLGEPPS
jgi:hypothetical protein